MRPICLKNKFKKILAMVLLVSFAINLGGSSLYAAKRYNPARFSAIRIPGGTPVVLELNQYVDSDHAFYKDQIHFRVKYNVMVDDKVVVAAGSIGYGHIMQLKKRKGVGRPGYVEIKVDRVTAVDGSQIILSSRPLMAEGENREALALGLGIGTCFLIGPLGLFFLCIKGGRAELQPGTEITANTLYDMEVKTL
jgi:hypothetical protein